MFGYFRNARYLFRCIKKVRKILKFLKKMSKKRCSMLVRLWKILIFYKNILYSNILLFFWKTKYAQQIVIKVNFTKKKRGDTIRLNEHLFLIMSTLNFFEILHVRHPQILTQDILSSLPVMKLPFHTGKGLSRPRVNYCAICPKILHIWENEFSS